MKKLLLVLLLVGSLFGSECEDHYSDYLGSSKSFLAVYLDEDFSAMKVHNDKAIASMKKYLLCVESPQVKSNSLTIYGNLLKIRKHIEVGLSSE